MLRLLAWLIASAQATDWEARMHDEDPRVRAQAYRMLADEDSPEALERIAQALATEADPGARAAGQDAMARVDLELGELEALLGSEQEIARAWAAHALGRHGSQATEALLKAADDPSELVRGEVYDALSRSDDPRALTALRKAAVKDPSSALRARAEAAALATIGNREAVDVPTEIARLQSGELGDRIDAAKRLGGSGDWRALEPLQDAARAGDLELRKASLLALGQLGDHRAVPELQRIATETAGPLRYHALAALAHLADESAVPTLQALMEDEDPTSRQLALRALAWTNPPDVAEMLMPAFLDPAEEVRMEALLAWSRIEDPGRDALLLEALDDPSPFVRAEAARLLGQTGDAVAGAALVPLLSDRDTLVRLSAAEACAQLGVGGAVEPLRKLVDKTRDPDEKAAYERALQALGG